MREEAGYAKVRANSAQPPKKNVAVKRKITQWGPRAGELAIAALKAEKNELRGEQEDASTCRA